MLTLPHLRYPLFSPDNFFFFLKRDSDKFVQFGVTFKRFVEGRKEDDEEGSGVLSGIGQVREGLFCVPVSAEALGEAQVGRKASHYGTDEPRLVDALVVIRSRVPIAFIGGVEANHVLEVQ